MQTQPATDFATFAERHARRLAQVADLFTGNHTEADQVTVDAFTAMFRIWPSVAGGSDPLAAARRCLTATYLRDARKRGQAGQQAAALELADDFGAAPKLPRGADASWEAVLDLSPRDRAVLVWRLFEQLPDSAVARTLATPPSLVARSGRRGLDHVGMTVGRAADEIAREHVVLGTALTRKEAVYEQAVLVPISGFSMVVRSPDKSVVLNVTASVQVVPDGFTVVPPCRGQRLRDASADLLDAGLKPVIQRASTISDKLPQPPVTFQGVDSGRLVPIGSQVSLFVPSF